MAIGKINNIDLSGGGGGNTPLFNEDVILYCSFGGTQIRAFGVETYTDLGVFYTSPQPIYRIKENYLDKSISVFCSNSPYITIIDVYGNAKYTNLTQPNSRVWDASIYEGNIYMVGQFTDRHRLVNLSNNTIANTSNLPSLNNLAYSCDVTTSGYVGVFGDFTNRFKVFDLNTLTEITGYPSIAEIPLVNFTSNTHLLPLVALSEQKEWAVCFRDTSYTQRGKVIGISSKSLSHNISVAGTLSTKNNVSFISDGNKVYFGNDSVATNNVFTFNIAEGNSTDLSVMGLPDRPSFIISNPKQTETFIGVNSNIYRYSYVGISLVGTYSLGLSVGTRQGRACATTLFKEASQ